MTDKKWRFQVFYIQVIPFLFWMKSLISLVAGFFKVILTLLMNMVLSLVVAVVRSSGPKLSQVLTILRPCCQGVIVLGNNVRVCMCCV